MFSSSVGTVLEIHQIWPTSNLCSNLKNTLPYGRGGNQDIEFVCRKANTGSLSSYRHMLLAGVITKFQTSLKITLITLKPHTILPHHI